MNNAVTAPKPPSAMALLRQGLEGMGTELKASLPKGVETDAFINAVITGIRTHKDTKKLIEADRRSLFNAVSMAASDGLILNGREAALVPFGDQVTYMPMVQGLVKLARNSGEITTIVAEIVYKNDKFTYRIGQDDAPVHEPDWFGEDRGAPVGVWALVTLRNGDKIPAILSKKKVMTIAGKSKNSAQYNADTAPYWDEWWKKTAIKNVLKYAPKSTQLEQALARENEEEFVDAETGEVTNGQPKKRTSAADKVKAAAAGMKPKEEPAEVQQTEVNPNVVDAEFTEEHQPSGGNDYREEEDDERIPLSEYGVAAWWNTRL